MDLGFRTSDVLGTWGVVREVGCDRGGSKVSSGLREWVGVFDKGLRFGLGVFINLNNRITQFNLLKVIYREKNVLNFCYAYNFLGWMMSLGSRIP